jgi:periplasmic divalent cation tolerance protein
MYRGAVLGMKHIVVFITIDSEENAQKLADKLLAERKTACVNIIPGVSSQYWWQGKIESADELMLVVKTRAALLNDLIQLVKENHPYAVPEIIALPIIGGNDDYLKWIEKETTIIPKTKSKRKISRLLKKVTKDNLHPEVDLGAAIGKEML